MAILSTVAQFGRYILRSRLSNASACEVWLAEIDGATGDCGPVVLKKLRAEFAQTPGVTEAFTQRANRAMRLEHACIARVLDVVIDRDERGYVVEYVDGKTLRQLISAVGGAGNALPIWFAIHVTRCICQALEHAHQAADDRIRPSGIAHESLCPENVFLTFDGHVKITDFGLSQSALIAARVPDSDELDRSDLDSGWKEPRTEAVGSVRNDLHGVGRILYELLTGICPELPTTADRRLVPPSHYAPWVNVDVDQLVTRILDLNHANRFETAGEVRSALDDYLSVRRHDVSSTHIAGLVTVLFSPECRDSAPPTMRLRDAATELAIRRSRRTTPPDFESVEQPTYNPVARTPLSAPPNSQLTRQTLPAPFDRVSPENSPMEAVAQLPPRTREGTAERSDAADARRSPFRHDWDLALKHAREEAQSAQRPSGEHVVASKARPTPPVAPAEQAVTEFERGLEHMRRSEFKLALSAWERALELDPQHRVCRANLSLLKKKLGSQT